MRWIEYREWANDEADYEKLSEGVMSILRQKHAYHHWKADLRAKRVGKKKILKADRHRIKRKYGLFSS